MAKVGKAVIFDLDGVIVNSQDLYEHALRGFLGNIGVGEINFESLVGMTTLGALTYLNNTHKFPRPIPDLTQEFQNLYQESFKKSLSEEHLVEGVRQFIERLAGARVRLAVASSAARPKIEFVLSKFGLARYFDCTVSGYEVKASKPAPDVFIQSAVKLHVLPSSCIVIEDSTNGIMGAKRAGMSCIGFLNPKTGSQDLSNADCVIKSFLETDSMTVHDGFLELSQCNKIID